MLNIGHYAPIQTVKFRSTFHFELEVFVYLNPLEFCSYIIFALDFTLPFMERTDSQVDKIADSEFPCLTVLSNRSGFDASAVSLCSVNNNSCSFMAGVSWRSIATKINIGIYGSNVFP